MLLQKHPELKTFVENYEVKEYQILTESGSIVEFWKKEDGMWHDYTEREKLREKIEREKEELERLKRQIARQGKQEELVEEDDDVNWDDEEDEYFY